MPLLTPEFSYLQFTLHLLPSNFQVTPSALSGLLDGLDNLLPETPSGTNWQFPAFQPQSFNFQIVAGVGHVINDAIVGQNEYGWMFRFAPQRLLIRQGQGIKQPLPQPTPEHVPGTRTVSVEHIASENDFLEIAERSVALLPEALRQKAVRAEFTIEKASFAADIDPGTWIAHKLGIGSLANRPLLDGFISVPHHATREFVMEQGIRQVCHDVMRVGNWFDAEGQLCQEGAVVFSSEIKTAFAEPTTPPSINQKLTPGFLTWDQVQLYLQGRPNSILSLATRRLDALCRQREA